jgi:predicted TIM-barrel fold metal-dependent hydrolase
MTKMKQEGSGATHAIIDSHHHIWRLSETPWLLGPPVPRIFGAYEPLRRDYSITDYMADAGPSGVVKSVFVQVNVAPEKEVDEAMWVASIARTHGFPHGITAFADLWSPVVGGLLDQLKAADNVKAIRQQLHWHQNPQYRFAPSPDVMNHGDWRRGLAEVRDRNLMFELQVFASQMRDAARLVQDFEDVQFVLLHAGMLEDRSEIGWELWRTGMRKLARCPNVMVKLSGLGTFERACSVELWRPVIEETVDMFGPQRCMFGSNFPIESLWTSYDRLVATVRECLAEYSESERRAILHDTAACAYGI